LPNRMNFVNSTGSYSYLQTDYLFILNNQCVFLICHYFSIYFRAFSTTAISSSGVNGLGKNGLPLCSIKVMVFSSMTLPVVNTIWFAKRGYFFCSQWYSSVPFISGVLISIRKRWYCLSSIIAWANLPLTAMSTSNPSLVSTLWHILLIDGSSSTIKILFVVWSRVFIVHLLLFTIC
jgi:hypothetical protein